MALTLYSSPRICYHPSAVVKSRFRGKKSIPIRNAMSKMGENVNQAKSTSKLVEFPHLSASHRALMADLIHAIEDKLENHLLPCTLSPDVEFFQNESGTSQGTLLIRSGVPASPMKFILGSWIHSKLPNGASLNIASLSAYLRPSTDAPNFLIEFIQSSPSSLILILDLPPRKDIVSNPDYLHTFYEQTNLDTHRQSLSKLPEFRHYTLSSLYFRSLISPTAITARIEADDTGGGERLEEIIKNQVGNIAREMLKIWLDECGSKVRDDDDVGEMERANLERRDELIMSKTIDIDLGSSLPRLFGQETADRVTAAVRSVFAA